MEAQLEHHPGYMVLRVKGDLRLWGHPEQEEEVVKVFRTGLDDPPGHLVLNLAEISFLDTKGILALVPVLVECSRRRIELKVVMPTGPAGDALRYVRVLDQWPVFDDEQAAVQALSSQAKSEPRA